MILGDIPTQTLETNFENIKSKISQNNLDYFVVTLDLLHNVLGKTNGHKFDGKEITALKEHKKPPNTFNYNDTKILFKKEITYENFHMKQNSNAVNKKSETESIHQTYNHE